MASFKGHIAKIRKLSGPEFSKPVKLEMAHAVKRFIGRRFSSQTDPRGKRWQSRKDNLPHKILDKSGALKESWQKARVFYTVTGFSISNKGVNYSAVHQTGRSQPTQMVARQVFPTDGTSPKVLNREFKKIVRRHQKKIMSK